MSVQIEARKNQMIMDLQNLRTDVSLLERSKGLLNDEYHQKVLETIRSTNEKIAKRTKTEGTKTEEPTRTATIINCNGANYYHVKDDNTVYNMDKTYVGFWVQGIPGERAIIFQDEDEEEDEEVQEDEKEKEKEEDTRPKQPANPLGLFLELPNIVEEEDDDILFAKYEQELDWEMSLMKEKLVKLEKVYSTRIAALDKRIHVLDTRIAELDSALVKFGSTISNIKMKRIKELTEMANSVWLHMNK